MVAFDQAVRFLGHTKRVLMIAAHPDDEDTELLTVLARGMGAETAYLALTRGEGGQNLIGNELGPALGIVRSEELLAARGLDGARQYFTRAYDFGFSKSLADTWKFWPSDSVLKDVVYIVRKFQPQVIVAVFSGTPRDGHGQHQASGWAAREAFQAAADPARFPELAGLGVRPWKTLKLYQSARFDSDTGVATLDGGALDHAVGQSFFQIAMRGRSLHRSQDMGAPQRMGPSTVRIRLVSDLTGAGPALFAGIDTTLAASLHEGSTGWSQRTLSTARASWARLIGDSTTWTSAGRDQLARLDAAAALASGVICDATTTQGSVVPGGALQVALACWNTSATGVDVSTRLSLFDREVFHRPGQRIGPGQVVTDSATVMVPEAAAPTQPYYLRAPMRGAFYDWRREDAAVWGDPADPAPLVAEFGVPDGLRLRRDVVYRTVDQAVGEVRRPLFIVPRVAVELAPASAIWTADPAAVRELIVTLRHSSPDTTSGTVSLALPAGWPDSPVQSFSLRGLAAEARLRFAVRLPAIIPHASYPVHAVVRDADGREYRAGITRVVYPHIRERQLVNPAGARIAVADFKLPRGGGVAYVRGAADRIPESLAALGLRVTVVPAESLAGAMLRGFRTVVIGPRAWETEPSLSAHNDRLLAWVRGGGTLIVQYQQFQYLRGGFTPFPVSLAEKPGDPLPARVGAPRVAEEDARVTVLQPSHPVFRAPNVIRAGDWEGWVQERGLYYPRSWGAEWTPLLEMADSGEPPQRGALLMTRLGRGTYVYTGLSFFRQLPAGVPGATRLFLNLLAIGRQDG